VVQIAIVVLKTGVYPGLSGSRSRSFSEDPTIRCRFNVSRCVTSDQKTKHSVSRNRPVERVSGRARWPSERNEARPVKAVWTGESPSKLNEACPSPPSRSTGCAGMSNRIGGEPVDRCPTLGHHVIVDRRFYYNVLQ
jgi:hypothetical protein